VSVKPADVEEKFEPGVPPREAAMRAAAHKAVAVARELRGGLVLGADTIVILDGDILGKPVDARQAAAMLRRLVGRTHVVTTGLALIDVDHGVRCLSWEDTKVHMRKASSAEIAAYVATGEPLDKAGAYGIQGHGALFVDRIEGCYFNVVGLPVARLRSMLVDVLGDPFIVGTRAGRQPAPKRGARSRPESKR
jgi:septum formation protein